MACVYQHQWKKPAVFTKTLGTIQCTQREKDKKKTNQFCGKDSIVLVEEVSESGCTRVKSLVGASDKLSLPASESNRGVANSPVWSPSPLFMIYP